ncbi:MAG: hypothetical protein EPO27_10675 [Betaproteobacteria bacterium]|nr:MAG: hypothetical protein EPO27_10675 [Betaproteobacteria bacterium]
MSEDERSEASITTPAGAIAIKSKRAAEFIASASMVLLFLLAYVFWEHKGDALRGQDQLAQAIKDLSQTNIKMVEAQREMNCLIAMPADRREAEYQSPYSICKRLAQ